jgi:predicted dehydrogenase
VRNLQAIGFKNISGFDLREDRRKEAEEKYKIKTFGDFEKAITADKYDAFIISVPPHLHHIYMKKALELSVPFFVEASVVDTDYTEIIKTANQKKIVAAPSLTLFFHPAIKKIFEVIKSGELGALSTFNYHSGQYLPDWHTYEKVSDFYVSQKSTGGAREIVPFELCWIIKLLGFPENVSGTVKKTIHIEGAQEIDDTYSALLDYGKFTLNITIDVVSRFATRRLLINGEKKQLRWDWDENCIKIFEPEKKEWKIYKYEMLGAAEGYNANITEQMYIDEMKNFFEAVEGKKSFASNLEFDHKVLKLLYAIEESYQKKSFVKLLGD